MTRRGDSGAATVLALATCAVIGLTAVVLAGTGLATVTRHRASLAADAAALAAAAHAAEGPSVACLAARRTVEADGATVVDCSVEGPYAVVRSRVAAPRWISWAGSAVGAARAGPDADAEETGGVARAS
jgi:secretion/DNA translocation related TadE-like protein